MRATRTLGPLALAAALLAGCEPAKYELMPLENARNNPPKPLVRQTAAHLQPERAPTPPVRAANAIWQPTGTEYRLPMSFVRPVGTVDGTMLYSFSWDEEPFDRLLAAAPGRPGMWVEYLEVY